MSYRRIHNKNGASNLIEQIKTLNKYKNKFMKCIIQFNV